MKKILLFAVIAVMATGVYAQENPVYMAVGISGGPSFAKITGDNTSGVSFLTGFHAALSFDLHINNHNAIYYQLGYNKQGAKYKTEAGNGDLIIDNMNMRMAWRYYIGRTHIFAELVPLNFDLLMGMKTKVGGKTTKIDEKVYHECNFGMGGGLGYTFKDRISIYARGIRDFTNIYKDSKVKNQQMVLEVGLQFYFAKF